MSKNLVIVESPAKAKTIENFLGKDYVVKSSFGHVRDLPKKGLGIELDNNFNPTYEIMPDKTKVINDLKKSVKESEVIWLATDEDREGEAIAWHLMEALKLKKENIKRIVFHEITKNAILEAIENPRSIDINLVNAQQARRVLDRLVGFEISPILWKKIKPSLSAGRVQSVAVRLIVEREKEIDAFNSTSSYKIVGKFLLKKDEKFYEVNAELPKKFAKKEEALVFLNKCKGANFSVGDIETKPSKKSPPPPFTTSTLQQEASRKLGFSVSRTMIVAQQLYESGKITYMRTDSVNLSKLALGTTKEEIIKLYGEDYVKTRQYTTKSKGAQEAHEAIRPTYINNQSIEGDSSNKKLYDLIWKRTIASQMSDALLEKTDVNIKISTTKEEFIARGEVIKFDGFLKVYFESTDSEDDEANEGMLPPMIKGEPLEMAEISATEKFTMHPPRYTEASLVKKLEDLGIGRPSTYAPTISTIQKRGYVVNESRDGIIRDYNLIVLKNNNIKESVKNEKTGFEKSKLFPTDIGIVVNDFLVQYFENILDYNFTANVEQEFDEIANGNIKWDKMIKEFYSPFHKQVVETLETSERASGERLLGTDPKSGNNVYVRIGRFGPMVQIGDKNPDEKPKFASLLKGQSIDKLTLKEALDLFNLPRNAGMYEDAEMVIGIGRFGPYVRHKSAFFSISKDDNPLTITTERAIEIIEAKRKKEIEKFIKEFPENENVKVLKGRWGAYISMDKKNFKIPKGMKAEELSLEDCLKIIKEANKK